MLIRVSRISSGYLLFHLELTDTQEMLIKSLQIVCFCLADLPLPLCIFFGLLVGQVGLVSENDAYYCPP